MTIRSSDHWDAGLFISIDDDSPNIRRPVNEIYCTMVSVDTLVSGVRGDRHFQCCGHSYQLGERIDSHLPHDLASVGFHRDLADTELECDLLVQQAGDHQCHGLPFTRGP